jgi:hypothetical protein
VFHERLLKRIEPLSMRKTLDRLDLSSVGPDRQIAAGVDRFAVQQHRAGSAFAAVATDFRTRKTDMIAEELGQSPTIFHVQSMLSAIYHESNRRAGHL